jgi:pyrroline-5-carboxylate reductase
MKIAIIGTGIIGSAIAESLLRSRRGFKVTATRRRVEKLKELKKLGANITSDNKKAANEADIIILCVKPLNVRGVLNEIKKQIEGKLMISVAAAIPLEFLKKIAPETRFVRAMPNVAVLVREAFTGYCVDSDVTPDDKKQVKEIFGYIGKYAEVDEKYMNAITALSGSGPAYISIIIEALMYAGLKVGLARDLALHSSAQTVVGAGKLILETKKTLSELKEMVVTPAGTTIDGIYELEGSGIRTAFMRAIEVATKKSEKITESIKNTKG